ncbi:uncharacterized protein LOC6597087 isoform X1 [Drosophila persimilis]|uniref:uncharacterized protein LOC6597087 isoform X1 n=1 Tax=Drosophila persimilis TaxID=7234 RepID=UPI000F094B0A|nr:uncharacterized protein LOC6597087 isoform X1 [Drosophila persimilis]
MDPAESSCICQQHPCCQNQSETETATECGILARGQRLGNAHNRRHAADHPASDAAGTVPSAEASSQTVLWRRRLYCDGVLDARRGPESAIGFGVLFYI